MSQSNQALFYTVKDIYRQGLIPVGKNTIYTLLHREDFPKFKVGRKYLIPVDGLHEWVQTTWNEVKSKYK